MTKLAKCATQHNVDTQELMQDAKVYEKRGMSLQDALLKAAEDKIALLHSDEAQIVTALKSAQEKFSPTLKSYDAADLRKAEADKAAAAKAEAETQKKLEEKAKADAEAKDFNLVGSDRKADANPNQGDLLSGKQSEDGAPIGRMGATPKVAENITVRNGDIYIGDEPAVNYETGKNVKAKGSSFEEIKAALRESGTVTSKDKFYRMKDDGIAGGETKLYDVTGAVGEGLIKTVKALYKHGDTEASQSARTAFKDVIDAMRDSKLTPKERMARVLRYMVIGEASAIKDLASARNSEALKKVWQHFSSFGGVEGVKGTPYEDAVHERYQRNANIVGKHLHGLDDNAINTIWNLLQNRKNINKNTTIGKAADAIAKALDLENAHQKGAGMDIGSAEDYAPRVYFSSKIVPQQRKFIAAATRAYAIDGMTQAEAKQAAENFYTAEALKASGAVEEPHNNALPKFTKSREISNKAFKESGLTEFTDPDKKHVLLNYFRKSATNIEYSKRFGGTELNVDGTVKTRTAKLDAIIKELRAEGNGDLERLVKDSIESMSGRTKQLTGGSKALIDMVRSLSVVQFLRKAAITSLAEPIQAYNRTAPMQGQLRGAANTAKMYAGAIADITNALGGRKLADELGLEKLHLTRDEKYRVAEMIGAIVNNHVADSVAANRFDEGFTDVDATPNRVSTAAHTLSNAAVTASYVRGFTNSTIVDAVHIGMGNIKYMVKELNGEKAKLAEYELERVGLTPEQGKSLVKYLNLNKNIDQVIDDMNNGNADAKNYVDAINTFQKQVIAQSTMSDRPSLAKHPVAKVGFNFQGWMTKYWYNMQKAGYKQIAMAIKNDRGFTPSQRAALIASPIISTIVTYELVKELLIPLRDWVSGKNKNAEFKEQQDAEIHGVPIKQIREFSQASGLGLLDPYVNRYVGARYNTDPAGSFGGAMVGNLSKYAEAKAKAGSDKNSESTNTDERALEKAWYYLTIDPLLASAAALSPHSTAATMLSQRDELQRMYVDTVAGQSVTNSEKKIKKSEELYEQTGNEKYFDLANISDSRKAIQSARRALNKDIKELKAMDDVSASEKERIEEELRADYKLEEAEFLKQFNATDKDADFWNK